MIGTRPALRDHLLGLSLCVAYVALLMHTEIDLGMARDESVYAYAAERYGHWFELLWHNPDRALQQHSIDTHFKFNHEHPGLVKNLFALSYLLEKHTHVFPTPTSAYRFVGMLSAGLLLWLLYIMGTRYGGRLVGLAAALLYALLPRAFYHAHLCCFDVPIVLAVTATTYAYARSLGSLRWVIWTGVLFGLALSTKHNSWILPGIFLIHFLYARWSGARTGGSSIKHWPHFLWAMALLGPPILVLTWPWLWHDPLHRFGWYARFHLHHEYYNMAYFGHNYFKPPFPISYPWVMTAFTVPVTTLLLCVVGLFREVRAELSRLRDKAPHFDSGTRTSVLWLGSLLAPMLLIALPSTPIFGATKHWLTAYPFLCLFAGVGFSKCVDSARQMLASMEVRPHLMPTGLLTVALLPAAVETAHSHPFGLSHYGVLAGGVPGAARLGMNRQFWGYTTGSLSKFFFEHLPLGGRVYICDMTGLAFAMMRRDGLLPRGVVDTPNLVDADYALVHHEHHFADVDFQIWTAYGSVQPYYVLTYDGVPIISVYKNPRRR